MDIMPALDSLPALAQQHGLTGEQGTNRERQLTCQLNANNDNEAIQTWLNEYQHSTATYRTYQREAERLLLWSVLQQHKPLSSLTRQDLDDYEQFLANPAPAERWCGPKRAKRGSEHWRPFVGPLSPSAKRTALAAIHSLFNYLVAGRYLHFNPLSLKRRSSSPQATSQRQMEVMARILEDDEWQAILQTLNHLPEQTQDERFHKHRLRLIVHMLFFLGLRVSELTQSTWNAFRKINDQLWFFVVGKGGKPAKIPVNHELLITLGEYRLFMRKPLFPDTNENDPIIRRWHQPQAMTDRRINALLKALALETAQQFVDQPAKQHKLKQFSAHWLRHLSASQQDRAGVKFGHIRANLRHESDETTRIYVHAADDERHAAIQQLTLVTSE